MPGSSRSAPLLSNSDRRPREDPPCSPPRNEQQAPAVWTGTRCRPRGGCPPDRPGAGPGTALFANGIRAAPHGVRRAPAHDLQPGVARGDARPPPAGRAWPRLAGRGSRTEDPRLAELPFGVRTLQLCRSPTSDVDPGSGRLDVAPAGSARTTWRSCKASVWTTWCWAVAWVPTRSSPPHPFESPHPAGSPAASTYGLPGWGGRQPVAYIGPKPVSQGRGEAARPASSRGHPGHGLLTHTTGSKDAVDESVTLDGLPIGYNDPATDPELHGDLDGVARRNDRPATPGTARSSPAWCTRPALTRTSSSWRIVPSDGPLVEKDWIIALAQILELVRRHAKKLDGGRAIDVLSLSMGYYHETPEDATARPDPSRHHGGVRSAAAPWWSALPETTPRRGRHTRRRSRRGRMARARSRSTTGRGATGVGRRAESERQVRRAVQQRRPLGAEVRARRCGDEHHARRTTGACCRWRGPRPTAGSASCIDPDDFRGGFAVWSGTSFAAPLLAGQLAAEMLPSTFPRATSPTRRRRSGARLERGGGSDRNHAMMSGWIARRACITVGWPPCARAGSTRPSGC